MSQHRDKITELLERLPETLLDAYYKNSIFHNLVQRAAKTNMEYTEFLELSTEYFIRLHQDEHEKKLNEAMHSTTVQTKCSCGAVLLYGNTHINCPDNK